jgi:hypothetical protein
MCEDRDLGVTPRQDQIPVRDRIKDEAVRIDVDRLSLIDPDPEFGHLLSALAAMHVVAADVMRPRALRRVVVMLRVVMMRSVMRMVGRSHHAVAHVQGRRSRPVVVMEVQSVAFNVIAVTSHVRAVFVPGRKRFDAEVLALHWTASLAHAVALADRAAFSCDFVPGSMARVFRHFATPVRCLRFAGPLLAVGGGRGDVRRMPRFDHLFYIT